MTKRIRKLVVAVAALAALALGGAVLAQAQTAPSAVPEPTTIPDGDNVQSGDQTTPDPAPKAAGRARHPSSRVASRAITPREWPVGRPRTQPAAEPGRAAIKVHLTPARRARRPGRSTPRLAPGRNLRPRMTGLAVTPTRLVARTPTTSSKAPSRYPQRWRVPPTSAGRFRAVRKRPAAPVHPRTGSLSGPQERFMFP
jgi:hypothetical protein